MLGIWIRVGIGRVKLVGGWNWWEGGTDGWVVEGWFFRWGEVRIIRERVGVEGRRLWDGRRM